ncbi:MAG: hypothetical protein KDA78_04885 [Planctomycetaceae bacterium]|nr:hypothetical protein [Planctomycetaceae bacterium]
MRHESIWSNFQADSYNVYRYVKTVMAILACLFLAVGLSPDQWTVVAQPPFGPPPGFQSPPAGVLNLPTPFLPPAAEPQVDYSAQYQGELHFELSERLLSAIVSRTDKQTGPVQDFIAGANVNGLQTTETRVDVAMQPSLDGARFAFQMQGNVESTTTARTPQAEVMHLGNSYFQASKGVMWNGKSFLAQMAIIQVMPNQRVMSARTPQGRMPLFGRMADRIAYNVAVSRTGESNLHAGQRLIQRLQPELDRSLDTELAKVNKTLQEKVWTQATQQGIEPVASRSFSSADRMYFDYRWGESPLKFTPEGLLTSVADSIEPRVTNPLPADVEFHLHERVVELAIGHFQLGGQVVSVSQMEDLLIRTAEMFSDMPAPESTPLPLDIDFRFAQTNPLQLQFIDGYVLLTLRGTFQAGNLPETTTQQILLKISLEQDQTRLHMKTTSVEVYEEGPGGERKTPPGITQTAIATQFRSQLVPLQFPRKFVLPETMAGKSIRLTQIEIGNGWLVSRMELVDATDVVPTLPDLSAPTLNMQPILPAPAPTFQPAP